MNRHRWGAVPPPDDLGAVVHGPVLLARGTRIAAGLRCVYAYPTGLSLPFVVRARGLSADVVARWSSETLAEDPVFPADHEPWSGVRFAVEVGDLSGPADPVGLRGHGGLEDFDAEGLLWVGELPVDGLVRLTVSWAEAGLPVSTTDLRLGDLSGLPDRVVPLP